MILYVENLIDVYDSVSQSYDKKSVYHCVIDGVDYGTIKYNDIPSMSTILSARQFKDFKNAQKDTNGKYIPGTIKISNYVSCAPFLKE